jgi:lipoprotein signal peptidase
MTVPQAPGASKKLSSLTQALTIISFVLVDQLAKNAMKATASPRQVSPLISLIVLGGGFYLLYRGNDNPRIRLAISAILAGGISNMIDYFRHGAILDNLQIGALQLNIADMFVIFGVGIIIVQSVRKIAQKDKGV